LKAKAIELAPPISGFFAENSLPQAFGANVVNVILVDFRALDTLGEITVLGIAAIGAMALIRLRIKPLPFDPTRSPLLSTAVRQLTPALALFAAFLFLRGHNNPGGGFIAALVAATAAGFVHLSCSPSRPGRLEPCLIVTGLSLAVFSGVLAVAAGQPFLTGLWWHGELPGGSPLHLGTPLIFDAGVFLAVLGFALSFLRRLLPTNQNSPSWN
jgi:multicomponent Na+:H+ antiporter subunit A